MIVYLISQLLLLVVNLLNSKLLFHVKIFAESTFGYQCLGL